MSIDLEYTDVQRAVAAAVERFCRDRCTSEVTRAAGQEFPLGLWRGIAELGVLVIATPAGSGGALEICAASEVLGRALFPGPLAATFFAVQVLPDSDRARVGRGEALVSVGSPPMMPWAPLATYYLIVEDDRAYSARARSQVKAVETIGGEPWGRVELERVAALGSAGRALAFHDVALAAYLAGAGQRLLELVCEHARTRRQFGRPIGDFQAVAHPLAECAMRLRGALALAQAAAFDLDHAGASALQRAAAARISACAAATRTLLVGHQTFGALGVTIEGPVYPFSMRIRQLISLQLGRSVGYASVLAEFGL